MLLTGMWKFCCFYQGHDNSATLLRNVETLLRLSRRWKCCWLSEKCKNGAASVVNVKKLLPCTKIFMCCCFCQEEEKCCCFCLKCENAARPVWDIKVLLLLSGMWKCWCSLENLKMQPHLFETVLLLLSGKWKCCYICEERANDAILPFQWLLKIIAGSISGVTVLCKGTVSCYAELCFSSNIFEYNLQLN